MATVKVTIGNYLAKGLIEEFMTKVDIADLAEVEMCAPECIGAYLEMHEGVWPTIDASFDAIVDACFYSIEEVIENDELQ